MLENIQKNIIVYHSMRTQKKKTIVLKYEFQLCIEYEIIFIKYRFTLNKTLTRSDYRVAKKTK